MTLTTINIEGLGSEEDIIRNSLATIINAIEIRPMLLRSNESLAIRRAQMTKFIMQKDKTQK